MNSRERLLAAIRGEEPDTIPVGIHNIGTYLPHLRRLLGRQIGDLEALKMLGLDVTLYRGYSETTESPDWREREELLSKTGNERIIRRTIDTPKGRLTTLEKRTEITSWTLEPLIKEPEDLDALRYRPVTVPDTSGYRKEFGPGFRDGIVRVGVWGQGEAVLLRGSKDLVRDFYLRPDWVREMYELLTEWALAWIEALPVDYVDLVEIAGHIGAFVSPDIYRRQIMPFDKMVVKALHAKGLPTSYHDCGRVMHVLEPIADTGTNCIETLTPPPFGGDVDLARAKELVGDRVCLIGGFHQSLIERGTPGQIEARIRECLRAAAEGGGYILYNTDHFFQAPVENMYAYARSARKLGRYA
jgi:uroporphyrinogen decarboxylase